MSETKFTPSSISASPITEANHESVEVSGQNTQRWYVEKPECSNGYVYVKDDVGEEICTFIASAPELYGSLKTMVDYALSPTFDGTFDNADLVNAHQLVVRVTNKILWIKEAS